jgi:hypothetical protein
MTKGETKMDKYNTTKQRLNALKNYRSRSFNEDYPVFSVPRNSVSDKNMEFYQQIDKVLFQAHEVIMGLVEEQIQKDQKIIDAVEVLLND